MWVAGLIRANAPLSNLRAAQPSNWNISCSFDLAMLTLSKTHFALFSLVICLPILVFGGQSADRTRIENAVLWRDPGRVDALDFAGGPAGREGSPTPPFVFHEEAGGGTGAKIIVKDANKREWEVKWGPETKPEVFASRLLWGVGYVVESSFYVPAGRIDSVGHLTRAESRIDRSNNNAFRDARFELRDLRSFPLPTSNWTWENNPFAGTRELTGLRVMTMLVSNWDTKDASSSDGPNTMILKVKRDDGHEEMHYMVSDWGATMGKWGNVATRGKWDCEGYKRQTPTFVRGVDQNGMVGFSYQGKHTDRIAKGIKVSDVQWLMNYLGAITDDQIRKGLRSSGANEHEVECFASSLRSRIEQLRRVQQIQTSKLPH
jgi:hypothetical protein